MTDARPEPAPAGAVAHCFHHRDRETGRSCTRCGRPACSECLHQASVGSHCWECIKAAQPPRSEQIRRRVNAMPSPLGTTIVVLNVVAFVATQGWNLRGNAAVFDWSVSAGPIAVRSEIWRVVTSGFIHFGVLHIILNMFIFSRILVMFEPTLGSLRLTGVYVASLFAGALGALAFDPFAQTGGASGAVLGTMAAIGVAMWHRGTSFWNTGFGPMLVITMVWSLTESNVSFGGHLGGIVGGVITGWFFFNQREPRRPVVATTGWIATAGVVAVSLAGSIVWSQREVDAQCRGLSNALIDAGACGIYVGD